jgi:integrase
MIYSVRSAAPPVPRHAEAAFQAGQELLQEWTDAGRVKTTAQLHELQSVISLSVMEAADADELAETRRVNAEFWREQMPGDLAEAMLNAAPANERWSASVIASTAAKLGINLERIDITAIAKEKSAAPAYVGPFATHADRLHPDLGVARDKPIPQSAIEAAAKRRDEVGQRARLALKLLSMSLDRYALAYFPPRKRLTDITPSDVAGIVAWLCKQTKPAPTKSDPKATALLADKSVRNYVIPLRACLATAVREGLLRTNPARDIDLPHRANVEDSEAEDVKAMTEAELCTLLALVPERHRLFFRVLASTGLRVSEAIALQWKHLALDGSRPHVKVRRALVKQTMGAPKSRHSKRDVPLDPDLALALREHRSNSKWPDDDDLAFTVANGSAIMPGNLRRRVLKPIAQEANVPWVGFHSFRHTCASLLFAQGRNAVQVQRWLGHHSAAFTLGTYVHLLDGDIREALRLPAYSEASATSLSLMRVSTTGNIPPTDEDSGQATSNQYALCNAR